MFNKNGKIYIVKNIWQRWKQIWTHCFFVASNYVVSYYRFLNTDPGMQEYLGIAMNFLTPHSREGSEP
jgi:hypothetical protein